MTSIHAASILLLIIHSPVCPTLADHRSSSAPRAHVTDTSFCSCCCTTYQDTHAFATVDVLPGEVPAFSLREHSTTITVAALLWAPRTNYLAIYASHARVPNDDLPEPPWRASLLTVCLHGAFHCRLAPYRWTPNPPRLGRLSQHVSEDLPGQHSTPSQASINRLCPGKSPTAAHASATLDRAATPMSQEPQVAPDDICCVGRQSAAVTPSSHRTPYYLPPLPLPAACLLPPPAAALSRCLPANSFCGFVRAKKHAEEHFC